MRFRPGPWLVVFWIALAIWLSDRWFWALPALGGVALVVGLSKWQRSQYQRRAKGLPPFELISTLLMVLAAASFLYLQVLLVVFQLGSQGQFQLAAIAGALILAALLTAAGLLAVRQAHAPRRLLRVWEWLLVER